MPKLDIRSLDEQAEHALAPEFRSPRAQAAFEVSDEPFDRLAFAQRALDLVRPIRTRIAICVEPPTARTRSGVRVETGRAWGRGPRDRWALLSIPAHASRRAIVAAVTELSGRPAPYALDVLCDLAEAGNAG